MEPTEQLIGRMVDGEASVEDEARFRALADSQPALWEQLAERQRDMLQLTAQFEEEIASALAVELPDDAARLQHPARSWSAWGMALAGWAAVLLLAVTWAVTSLNAERPRNTGGAPVSEVPLSAAPELTPDEHLARYLGAPNVLGELDPIVLEVEELSDGRLVVRYLRRIEEVIFVDAGEDAPVSDSRRLTIDPSELRDSVKAPRIPD